MCRVHSSWNCSTTEPKDRVSPSGESIGPTDLAESPRARGGFNP